MVIVIIIILVIVIFVIILAILVILIVILVILIVVIMALAFAKGVSETVYAGEIGTGGIRNGAVFVVNNCTIGGSRKTIQTDLLAFLLALALVVIVVIIYDNRN